MSEECVNCLECFYCSPHRVAIGLPDWDCRKYNRYMSMETIGDHFSCKGFRKKKVKE